MGRKPCCSKEDINRGAWTAEEDRILKAYIKANGEGRWRSLPKKAGLKRCGKSCRLRWLNYLRPDIKRGNITCEEEDLIIRLHRLLGNKWSLIAGRLPGRTDNEIKNYWNTCLKKKVQGQHQAKRCQPSVKEANELIRTKAIQCANNMFIPPQQRINAQNQEKNITTEPAAMVGELASEKVANSRSDHHSPIDPRDDNWWDLLVGLDKTNGSASEAPDLDFMQIWGTTESPCSQYTRIEMFEDWMSDATLPFEMELKSLADFLNCEDEWLGGEH